MSSSSIPLPPIDLPFVSRLVAAQCNQKQIAQALGLTEKQLRARRKKDSRLDEILAQVSKEASLRRAKPIDYKLVHSLAGLDATDYQIARKLGYSVETQIDGNRTHRHSRNFSRRKGQDPLLRDALDDGRVDGELSLLQTAMQKCRNQCMTICRDCGKKAMGPEFMASCPYCDALEEDPDLTGNRGAHTKVKHQLVLADTAMTIFCLKNRLHWSDKVQISGDDEAPLQVETKINEKDLDAKIERYVNQRKAKSAPGTSEGSPG